MHLENAFELIRVGRYHFLQCFLNGGLWLVDGAEMMVTSAILGALQSQWNITDFQKGCMMSLVFVGIGIGGLLGGRAADRVGRKPVVVASYLGVILFGMLTAIVHSAGQMVATTFCLGICLGAGVPAVMALTLESAPDAAGKHLLNLGLLWFSVGEVYAAFMLFLYMADLQDATDFKWREVALLTVVPSLVLLPVLAASLQESPTWLVSQGRKEEALRILQHIARFNGNAEAKRVLEELHASDLHNSEIFEATPLLAGMESASPNFGSTGDALETGESAQHVAGASPANSVACLLPLKRATAWDLLGMHQFRASLLAGAWLCMVANLMFFGISYVLPGLFKGVGSELSPAVQLMMAAGSGFPGVALGDVFLLIRQFTDRDRLVILLGVSGALEASIAHFGMNHDVGPMVQLVLICVLKTTLCAYFNLAYVLLSRIFPSVCRCTATSFCITGGRIGSMAAPLICELLRPYGGRDAYYFVFCMMLCIVSMLVIRMALEDLDHKYVLDEDPEEPTGRSAGEGSAASCTSPASGESAPARTRLSRRISNSGLAADISAEDAGEPEGPHPLASLR